MAVRDQILLNGSIAPFISIIDHGEIQRVKAEKFSYGLFMVFGFLYLWVTMGGQWIVLPQKGNGLVVEERESLKEAVFFFAFCS